jgi:molybdate transport system substrate-binding protein
MRISSGGEAQRSTPRGSGLGILILCGLTMLGGLSMAGCRARPQPGEPSEVLVFAAASLGESFQALAADFEAEHPEHRLVFNFAGSNALATQLLEGARADVFASADGLQMQRLEDAGLLAGPPRIFARNRMLLIVSDTGADAIRAPEDLLKPGLRLVLAGPDVPAGRYARQALARAGLWPAAEINLVSEEADVKGVVGKVAMDEADAGIVYATDVTPAVAGSVHVLVWAEMSRELADYPAAVLAAAGEPEGAAAFLSFLASEAAARALTARGFDLP